MLDIKVTITGADDKVDPYELDKLGGRFSFVEWAILFSATRQGEHRYPYAKWKDRLYTATANGYYRLAAHLCGSLTEQFLVSRNSFESEITMAYDTIQFNKFTAENKDAIFTFAKERPSAKIVVPYNNSTLPLLNGLFDEDVPKNVHVLLDASGGRGLPIFETEGWPDIPEPFASRLAVGYAGGIHLGNVEAALESILTRHDGQDGEVWIDLETGARTVDDEFDLDKVSLILETVDNYLKEF